MDERLIQMHCFLPYYLSIFHLVTYDQMTPFSYATRIPRYYCAHIFVSNRELLFVRNMVCKIASVKKMFHSGMFNGEHALMEMYRPGEKTSYQGVSDV